MIFTDVETIPENGTWFQLVANGTTTINNGTNGLAKLDMVVKHAENFGIYLMLTLTNNWNPGPNVTVAANGMLFLAISTLSPRRFPETTLLRRDTISDSNRTVSRNTLSNDYGGMDTYVRQYGLTNHDQFYTNETLITAFHNFTTQVVSRYVDSPAIFAWFVSFYLSVQFGKADISCTYREVANDPR